MLSFAFAAAVATTAVATDLPVPPAPTSVAVGPGARSVVAESFASDCSAAAAAAPRPSRTNVAQLCHKLGITDPAVVTKILDTLQLPATGSVSGQKYCDLASDWADEKGITLPDAATLYAACEAIAPHVPTINRHAVRHTAQLLGIPGSTADAVIKVLQIPVAGSVSVSDLCKWLRLHGPKPATPAPTAAPGTHSTPAPTPCPQPHSNAPTAAPTPAPRQWATPSPATPTRPSTPAPWAPDTPAPTPVPIDAGGGAAVDSATASSGGPSPVLFVGILGGLFVVGALITALVCCLCLRRKCKECLGVDKKAVDTVNDPMDDLSKQPSPKPLHDDDNEPGMDNLPGVVSGEPLGSGPYANGAAHVPVIAGVVREDSRSPLPPQGSDVMGVPVTDDLRRHGAHVPIVDSATATPAKPNA